MTGFDHFVHTPLAKALGWTLLHSLWEGALAALVLLAIVCFARSPRVRYACASAALLAVLAGFALTFFVLVSGESGNAGDITRAIPKAPILEDQSAAGMRAPFQIADTLPWLAPFWIAGVVAFQLRSLAAWLGVKRLRHRGVCCAPDPWPQRLKCLSATLRVSRPVALLETCLTDVPVVAGYLRPVILVPAGMLAGMPAAQVEAILMHELAHIQRHDYLANLLQQVAEGFLFYHPAIWWMSHVIRAERENCCDDLVVAASGDALEYASALAALEHTRRAAIEAAPAATGGNLVKRIHRLLYRPEGLALAPLLSAGILAIVLAGALAAWQSSTQVQDRPETAQTPYSKWLNQDVVYIITPRERAAFQKLRTDAERDRFIEQFWLRRDPTPGTPENEFKAEHYRRIAYANDHFASGMPGWKTDRGRIYIMFGPADEMESHPSGRPATAGVPATDYPVEAWLYHHIDGIGDQIIAEFADKEKNGNYRMTEDPKAGRK